MWGHRVCIPSCLINEILKELHAIHFGIVKTKSMARSYVWWPEIDRDIERLTKECKLCLENADNPPRSILNCWSWPIGPGYRVHIDFCGPIENKMYLIITDAYSKWIDCYEMNNITAETTIKVLKSYFSTWGLPHRIVSDNGPTYTSVEFEQFLKSNNIAHVKTAPYHPASNGAAENAVRTFKVKFPLLLKSKYDRQEDLSRYLFYYRATPHCTTELSPAMLQIGRDLRTKLDTLKPNAYENVKASQERQARNFQGNRNLALKIDDVIVTKDYKMKNSWVQAKVLSNLAQLLIL